MLGKQRCNAAAHVFDRAVAVIEKVGMAELNAMQRGSGRRLRSSVRRGRGGGRLPHGAGASDGAPLPPPRPAGAALQPGGPRRCVRRPPSATAAPARRMPSARAAADAVPLRWALAGCRGRSLQPGTAFALSERVRRAPGPRPDLLASGARWWKWGGGGGDDGDAHLLAPPAGVYSHPDDTLGFNFPSGVVGDVGDGLGGLSGAEVADDGDRLGAGVCGAACAATLPMHACASLVDEYLLAHPAALFNGGAVGPKDGKRELGHRDSLGSDAHVDAEETTMLDDGGPEIPLAGGVPFSAVEAALRGATRLRVLQQRVRGGVDAHPDVDILSHAQLLGEVAFVLGVDSAPFSQSSKATLRNLRRKLYALRPTGAFLYTQ
ncbi:unnamed protein product [Prorocentrum cordatum]|uniref:Uncharacterized protein n=1 Tax=Prorocentrum cordatum TaxID=2364126 RepID=A0ABN9VA98_9DINO|nr:unnamed protein product [Polarella glacialis]